MSKKKKDEEYKDIIRLGACAAFFIFCCWLFNLGVLVNLEDPGKYGDLFGAVNALFSGLAFAGVIIAILLQSRELKAQQKELKLTTKALRDQQKEFVEQNKTLKQQRFENTFFQMLSLHNEFIESIIIYNQRGRSGLEQFKRIIDSRLNSRFDSHKGPLEDLIKKIYDDCYGEQQHQLSHYFRMLYRIIKFVDESDLDNKKYYTNIVRAQLSNQELGILFYNCLGQHGYNKFKPLVEKYQLLNNIPVGGLPEFNEVVKLYDVSAYGINYPQTQ